MCGLSHRSALSNVSGLVRKKGSLTTFNWVFAQGSEPRQDNPHSGVRSGPHPGAHQCISVCVFVLRNRRGSTEVRNSTTQCSKQRALVKMRIGSSLFHRNNRQSSKHRRNATLYLPHLIFSTNRTYMSRLYRTAGLCATIAYSFSSISAQGSGLSHIHVGDIAHICDKKSHLKTFQNRSVRQPALYTAK